MENAIFKLNGGETHLVCSNRFEMLTRFENTTYVNEKFLQIGVRTRTGILDRDET